jgi:hypothetical protein
MPCADVPKRLRKAAASWLAVFTGWVTNFAGGEAATMSGPAYLVRRSCVNSAQLDQTASCGSCRNLAMSLVGAFPKKRLYSLLNCEALR